MKCELPIPRDVDGESSPCIAQAGANLFPSALGDFLIIESLGEISMGGGLGL